MKIQVVPKYSFRWALKCALCRKKVNINDIANFAGVSPEFIRDINKRHFKTTWGDERFLAIARKIGHPDNDVFIEL